MQFYKKFIFVFVKIKYQKQGSVTRKKVWR